MASQVGFLSKKTGVDLPAAIDDETQNMIVATPESIRYYSHLRKLETILLDMPKRATIHKYHKNYLLIVSLSGEDLQLTRVVIIDLVK